MQHCIYFLKHPLTKEIRYVGKTNNPTRRLIQHTYTARHKTRKSHCCSWIGSLLKDNQMPVMCIVNWFNSEEDCNNAEKLIIENFKKTGMNLTNLTDGGEGQCGRIMSEETRKKISESQLKRGNAWEGKKRPPEIGLKISLTKTGKKFSIEHKKKLSEAKKGRIIPIQTRIKMSISGKLRASIPENRNALISRLEQYKMSQV
jgi:predicted GIY-YIG superfamily endonuclease